MTVSSRDWQWGERVSTNPSIRRNILSRLRALVPSVPLVSTYGSSHLSRGGALTPPVKLGKLYPTHFTPRRLTHTRLSDMICGNT